jgi:hypothetical protein
LPFCWDHIPLCCWPALVSSELTSVILAHTWCFGAGVVSPFTAGRSWQQVF